MALEQCGEEEEDWRQGDQETSAGDEDGLDGAVGMGK